MEQIFFPFIYIYFFYYYFSSRIRTSREVITTTCQLNMVYQQEGIRYTNGRKNVNKQICRMLFHIESTIQ